MGGFDDLERRRATYAAALDLMRRAITPEWYEAARMFESVMPFEDAGSLAEACRAKARLYYEQRETERKDKVYATAMDHMGAGSFELAAEIFGTIPGWRDANGRRVFRRTAARLLVAGGWRMTTGFARSCPMKWNMALMLPRMASACGR